MTGMFFRCRIPGSASAGLKPEASLPHEMFSFQQSLAFFFSSAITKYIRGWHIWKLLFLLFLLLPPQVLIALQFIS